MGCGVTLVKLKQKKAEFQKLDKVIRENVPCGFGVRKKPHRYIRDFDFLQLNCVEHVNVKKAEPSLGTLGGGIIFSNWIRTKKEIYMRPFIPGAGDWEKK